MNRPSQPFRTTQVLGIAAVAAVLIAVAAALIAGRAGEAHDAPEAGSIEAIAEELAKGQASDRAELNANLATAAEVAHGHLVQVLQELASAVPVGETGSSNAAGVSGPAGVSDPAGDSAVDGWKRELELATSSLETVEEGTSEQTVAREAFVGAVELLQSAADAYQDFLSAPVDEQAVLAATVAERRDAAVRLWQAGAAQLDTLTVGSGVGHVHLFLTPDGDPDSVPAEFREPEDGSHS